MKCHDSGSCPYLFIVSTTSAPELRQFKLSCGNRIWQPRAEVDVFIPVESDVQDELVVGIEFRLLDLLEK
ncbi:hypothetical protein D918_04765 [Trichuris suis]|nr:hypothetical protein D918_04765 [Trichuris suis]